MFIFIHYHKESFSVVGLRIYLLALAGHRKFLTEELIEQSARCWMVNSISSDNCETTDVNKQEA